VAQVASHSSCCRCQLGRRAEGTTRRRVEATTRRRATCFDTQQRQRLDICRTTSLQIDSHTPDISVPDDHGFRSTSRGALRDLEPPIPPFVVIDLAEEREEQPEEERHGWTLNNDGLATFIEMRIPRLKTLRRPKNCTSALHLREWAMPDQHRC
jgi:hypothetical protein